MKRFHVFQLFTGVVFFATFFVAFPSTIKWLEGDDLFLFTPEYFANVCGRQQGITYLISNFVQQFFASPWLGALIYSLIMLISSEFFALTLNKLGKKQLLWIAVLPAPIIVLLRFPDIPPSLYLVFFALALYVFAIIKSRICRCIYVFLLPLFSFAFMPWGVSVVMALGFAAIEFFANRNKLTAVIMLVCVVESLLVPSLWSDIINFIPFEARPFNGFGEDSTWSMLAVYAAMVVICAVPRTFNVKWWIGTVVVVISTATYVVLMVTNDLQTYMERLQRVSLLADAKDWSGVSDEISYDDYMNNKAYTAYALLADNARGMLPQNLMKYPINDAENFLFRHATKSFLVNFNRQFYDNIGIWDEAFHQAFEYGVNSRENECFKTLRYKTDYALATYDLGTAEKYINLLKRSCTHADWVSEHAAKLDSLKRTSRPECPNRSDTFVGAYLMPSEMFRLFERDPQNRNLLDYVLCSLLLKKEVDKFGIILKNFNLYEGETLPRVYAEAAAALAVRDTSARSIGIYDHNLEQQYLDCMNKARSGADCSEYAGTYWAYLLFRELPERSGPAQQ